MVRYAGAALTTVAALSVVLTVVYAVLGIGVVTLPSGDVVVALETAIVLMATLAALLMGGCSRRDRGGQALVAVAALGALALSALLGGWLRVVGQVDGVTTAAGARSVLLLVAASLLMAFALAPQARLSLQRWSPLLVAVVLGASASAVGLLVVIAAGGRPGPMPGTGLGHVLTGSLTSAALMAAAFGFARGGSRSGDPFRALLAVSMFGLSLARLHEVFVPGLGVRQLSLGDMFRALAFVLLLTGVLWEVRRSWERFAADSLTAERRRIARQLHDGIAHEASYIAIAAQELAQRTPSVELTDVIEAAERTLDETRRVIHVFSRPPEEPLDVLLVSFAEQIAHRSGARVRSDCAGDLYVDSEVAEALTRIVRESVSNAVRHGGADVIVLRLRQGERLELSVQDNGSGFDGRSSGPPDGFGLVSMRERAEGLGGIFQISSQPGTGTRVEVAL